MDNFDFDAFRAMFPEFDCATDEQIQAGIDLACALRGNFCYVEDQPKLQRTMQFLSVAHELRMNDCMMVGGSIKRVKSLADEIEFQTNNGAADDTFGLAATRYGSQLSNLMRITCANFGFTTGGVASSYATDIGYYSDCCDCY